jgi:hypothetical protein
MKILTFILYNATTNIKIAFEITAKKNYKNRENTFKKKISTFILQKNFKSNIHLINVINTD